MIVLSDNDIILKLAAFDALEAAIALLGVPAREVRVLHSALPTISKGKKILVRYGRETVERAAAFVEKATPIVERSSYDAEVEMLRSVEMIDAGEQLLFASTRDFFPNFNLLTGDKRALRALRKAPEARPIYDRLRGRVVCLEEITRILILRHGFEKMRDKIVPACQCDQALRAAFGSGMLAQEANVLIVLQDYFEDLENGNADENGVGANWLKRLAPLV